MLKNRRQRDIQFLSDATMVNPFPYEFNYAEPCMTAKNLKVFGNLLEPSTIYHNSNKNNLYLKLTGQLMD